MNTAPADLGERVLTLGPVAATTPRLSVLTPFHRYDPSPLLNAMANAPRDVEFVLLDDGSGSAELLARVISAASATGAPVRVIVWAKNQGRAAGRNRLVAEARGAYVLFLDADMIPDTLNFLARWLAVADEASPVAAFGGLSLNHAAITSETALHHNLFGASDCRDARARSQSPAQFTASANLMVRRDFLAAHPFDNRFVGWGFEDVDWALSAAANIEILHVDNSATHAGLDDVDTLIRKSAEAGPNFARLAAKHPREVSRFSAHRVASWLRLAPARETLRTIFAWIARDPLGAAPMNLRRAALKLFRASHYAEHLA
ncbi:glycosyltransferase family A protein [Terricaulis sp.]|uniref:glycosyltransferase family 2 protein n=1 Tax=Terricaulis sp. TaxID=2768686 RepID=UPI002AC3DC8C|nr:glycosyltransferase family A protein [Terricaulis sp.]MDZ4690794.1 glycosyltransferase family A protein [Terricaulis sp.]